MFLNSLMVKKYISMILLTNSLLVAQSPDYKTEFNGKYGNILPLRS